LICTWRACARARIYTSTTLLLLLCIVHAQTKQRPRDREISRGARIAAGARSIPDSAAALVAILPTAAHQYRVAFGKHRRSAASRTTACDHEREIDRYAREISGASRISEEGGARSATHTHTARGAKGPARFEEVQSRSGIVGVYAVRPTAPATTPPSQLHSRAASLLRLFAFSFSPHRATSAVARATQPPRYRRDISCASCLPPTHLRVTVRLVVSGEKLSLCISLISRSFDSSLAPLCWTVRGLFRCC